MEENEYGPGVNSTRDLVIKVLTHLRYIDKDLEKFKEELAKKVDKEIMEEIILPVCFQRLRNWLKKNLL